MGLLRFLPAAAARRCPAARARPAWQLLLATAIAATALVLHHPRARADAIDDAFAAARDAIAPTGWTAELEVVNDRNVTIALGARFRNRVCHVYALRTSAYLVDALRQLDQPLRRPYLEALFAHELGHCEEQYLAQVNPGLLDDAASPLLLVTSYRLADGGVRLAAEPRQILWREILADAYTAVYLNERYPGVANRLIEFHLSRRALRSAVDPDHDTAPYLRDLSFQRQPGERWSDVALRLRRVGTAQAGAERPPASGPDADAGAVTITTRPRKRS